MQYDVIVVGGGPAGLTAGIYAQRAGLEALLLEKYMPGGQAVNAPALDNYPGCDGLPGAELVFKMEEQAKRMGLRILQEEAVDFAFKEAAKAVITAGQRHEAKTVILALGARHRKLGVEGEDGMLGRGLSYCATCDGAFFRGMDVAVVGGGDTAVSEALFLSRMARSVTLIHRRGQLRAASLYERLLRETENIRVMWDSVVTGFEADAQLSGLRVRNVKTEEAGSLPVQGVFIAIGHDPQTDVLQGHLPLADGYVETDRDMRTGLPGVFAAGDIRQGALRQIITAAADGAMAAVRAAEYITRERR